MATPRDDSAVIERLYRVIVSRRGGDPEKSYTAMLLALGSRGIARKFGEEAVETIVAAAGGSREEVVAESADVLYHLLVLWADAGIAPDEVWAELARREGVSGVAEKASRPRRGAGP